MVFKFLSKLINAILKSWYEVVHTLERMWIAVLSNNTLSPAFRGLVLLLITMSLIAVLLMATWVLIWVTAYLVSF